jgi:hypothetical protein
LKAERMRGKVLRGLLPALRRSTGCIGANLLMSRAFQTGTFEQQVAFAGIDRPPPGTVETL